MNQIQRLRLERGLSQRDLAERAGVSAGTIACAERPGASLMLETAVALARALGVSTEELLSARSVALDRKIDARYAARVVTALRIVGFNPSRERIEGATPREIAQRLAPKSRLHRRMAVGAIEGALEHSECVDGHACSGASV